MLGTALVELGNDGSGLVVHGGHDSVDDVNDAVVGPVVGRDDLASVGGHLLVGIYVESNGSVGKKSFDGGFVDDVNIPVSSLGNVELQLFLVVGFVGVDLLVGKGFVSGSKKSELS